jgi:hypothetical protein
MSTKTINLLLVSAIAFSLLSCAVHTGTMSNSASLNTNNFRILQTVTGKSKATYILGIGGLDRMAMVAEARQDLLQKNPLKIGQTLANVMVDSKRSIYFGVYSTLEITVTADIVQFNDTGEASNNAFQPNAGAGNDKNAEIETHNTPKPIIKEDLLIENIHNEKHQNLHEIKTYRVACINNRLGNKVNSCQFNGLSSFIRYSGFNPNTIKSINFWMKPNSFNFNNTALFSLTDSLSGGGISFYKMKRKIYFKAAGINSTAAVVEIDNDINLNAYTMVTCLIDDSGILRLLINGKLVGVSLEKTPVMPENVPLIIGANRDMNNEFFEGVIEDFELFDHALIGREIIDLYSKK